MIHRLFVYGTLAPGRQNAHVLAGIDGDWQPATARGRLLTLGWGRLKGFPGVILDADGDVVEGLLLTADALPEHWARLDDFEGDSYERVVTDAVLQDGTVVPACVYQLSEKLARPPVSIEFLADHHEALPQIAGWHYDEWYRHEEGATLAHSLDALRPYAQGHTLPCGVVAVLDGCVAGAASLKHHELTKLYPDFTPWLGSVYVDTPFRGHGIARQLVQRVIELAKAAGAGSLYLQTEALDGGLYGRMGWQPIERRSLPRGVEVLVMHRSL